MLVLCHPLAMLWHCFATKDGWRQMFIDKHIEIPSSLDSPWHVILYTDEVTPGDVNAISPSRKMQAIYYSFKELGRALLCKEDAWFCALVARSSQARSLATGGLAQIIGGLLKAMFKAAHTNLQTTGLFLRADGYPSIRLFARLAVVVQDGAAHKELWGCRDGTRM